MEDYTSIIKIAKEQNRLIDFSLDFGFGGFGYIVEMDEDQLLGLSNNIKGILHEIQFVEIENNDE